MSSNNIILVSRGTHTLTVQSNRDGGAGVLGGGGGLARPLLSLCT